MSALYVLTHRVHLFLAYLSNPSEISFRSYLTEQSFRHHLSRLEDPADPDHTDSENSKTNYRSSSAQPSSPSFGLLESGSSAFHFSNRAAIALRTPRHAFHSFGFFTIAAVIPNLKAHPPSRETGTVVSSNHNTPGTSDHDLFTLKEAWFVGAFGRWWRGGVVDPAWSPNPSPHSKGDEEGWSSGILSIKALDRLEDFNGKLAMSSMFFFFADHNLFFFYFYFILLSTLQASPFQPLPTTLAHLNDRHLQSYAPVIDRRLVLTAALHHLRFRNLPSYLFTRPSTASPRPLPNPPSPANGPSPNIILLRPHHPQMGRLQTDLCQILTLLPLLLSSPNK